jgi:hypothetical protein
MLAECKPFQRTIIGELDHAAQSAAWLLTLPTQPAYRLKDDAYRLATRKRLGMLPDSSLQTDSCVACHGRNLELPQLRRDPHHAEACTQHTSVSVTQRHNMIVHTLAQLARSVGASVRTDQPPLGTALVPVTDSNSGEVHYELQHSDRRGDLLIVLGAKRLLVDVTVRRATATTNMQDAASSRPGHTVAIAEKKKRRKYEELCKARHMTFVPFAVESYGGIGPAARKLLTQLAEESGEVTAQAFLTDAFVRLSVTLQRGNALVLQQGMQQLRIDQLQLAGGDGPIDSSRVHAPASRRRQQRTLEQWRQSELDLAQAFHGSMRAGGGAAAMRTFRAGRVSVEACG